MKEEPATSVLALNLLSELLYIDVRRSKFIVEKFCSIQLFRIIYELIHTSKAVFTKILNFQKM